MRTTNRLTLIGHVASIKPFERVTKVTVATNRTWTANGEEKSAPSYVPVSVLDARQASWVAGNVGVGDLVHIEARVEEASFGEGQSKAYVVNVIAETFNLLRRKSAGDERAVAA